MKMVYQKTCRLISTKILLPFDGRVITFKQDQGSSAYHYLLADGDLNMGDYYYHRSNGAFCCIQRVSHEKQLKYRYPKVVATNNEKYKSIFNSNIKPPQ